MICGFSCWEDQAEQGKDRLIRKLIGRLRRQGVIEVRAEAGGLQRVRSLPAPSERRLAGAVAPDVTVPRGGTKNA